MKLLIVEDNSAVRRVIRSMLAGFADQIFECADGAEAIVRYSSERPDVVLMDIQMAGMDGITATRYITAADPSARVIIVTDYDQLDVREAAREAGASGFVAKENLLEIISLLEAPREQNRERS